MHINEVMKVFPVEIELYGFDNGSGLPVKWTPYLGPGGAEVKV
jgi:hypothetical protein